MVNGIPNVNVADKKNYHGLKSSRQKQVLDWSKWFGNFIDVDKAKKVTSNDGTLDTKNPKIDHIDMRYGNFCNQKCRMCGPHDSPCVE